MESMEYASSKENDQGSQAYDDVYSLDCNTAEPGDLQSSYMGNLMFFLAAAVYKENIMETGEFPSKKGQPAYGQNGWFTPLLLAATRVSY